MTPVAVWLLAAAIAGAPAAPKKMFWSGDKVWAKRPSPEDIGAAYPAKAGDAVVASAQLHCQVTAKGALTGCKVAHELFAGRGLGAAALSLAPKFQLSPEAIPPGKVADVWVGFFASQRPLQAKAASGPDLQPQDLKITFKGSPGDFAPQRAVEAGVSGLGRIRCAIDADGSLRLCELLEESPPGYGFGQASLAVAGMARADPATKSGEPTAGRHVAFPYEFNVRAR